METKEQKNGEKWEILENGGCWGHLKYVIHFRCYILRRDRPQELGETLGRFKAFRIDLWFRLPRCHLKHRVETQREESRVPNDMRTLQPKRSVWWCIETFTEKYSLWEYRGLQYEKARTMLQTKRGVFWSMENFANSLSKVKSHFANVGPFQRRKNSLYLECAE